MPTFKAPDVVVIFVLGGPGAGKGTQCGELVKDCGFRHFSAGDLLREEQTREGSTYGEIIKTCIVEGKIVPMEITIKLLENAMVKALQPNDNGEVWGKGKGVFLIDGFPRKMDQALKFEEDVCHSSMVIYFETSFEVMKTRLLKRGETSGRADDNEASIMKRFETYETQTKPVIDHYLKVEKVLRIDSSRSVQEVHEETKTRIFKKLSKNSDQ